MSKQLVFEDMFVVKSVDPDGKKFDRVSRIFGDSESYKTDLILDVNTQMYPMKEGEKFRMALAFSLRDDGLADEGEYDPTLSSSLMKMYQYVMYGKIYRVEGDDASSESSRLSIYASFGGLLMRLQGDASALNALEMDKTLYLLVKKISA